MIRMKNRSYELQDPSVTVQKSASEKIRLHSLKTIKQNLKMEPEDDSTMPLADSMIFPSASGMVFF